MLCYNKLMVKAKNNSKSVQVEETTAAQRQKAEKTLSKSEEKYREKTRSLEKTRRALERAPISRKKTEEKLKKQAKKKAVKTQKKAENALKKAQKKFKDGKISSDEFAKFQQDLANAAEEVSKTAGEEYVFAEAKFKRYLRRHKIDRDVFDSFSLNALFVLVEIIGGLFTGSTAILANAIRDLGDVFNIVFAYLFQKRNIDRGDKNFTFGYSRHVVMASFATTAIILIGSSLMIVMATIDLITGNLVSAGGMIILGLFGLIVNGFAIFRPRKRGNLRSAHGKVSLWRRSIDLGIFDDCIGWLVVFVCGIIIAVTGWRPLDAVCGIIISVVVIVSSFSNFRRLLDIFLEKAPESPSVDLVRTITLSIPHVTKVNKIHIWHLDLESICVTLHVEIDDPRYVGEVKAAVRRSLTALDVKEATIEVEAPKIAPTPAATPVAANQATPVSPVSPQQ